MLEQDLSYMSDPIYLPRLQSLRRGIRHGWYIVDEDGDPDIGPFATREACMDQAAAGAMALEQHIHAGTEPLVAGVRLRIAQAKWDRLSASDYEGIRTIPELIAKVAQRYSLPHEEAKNDVETWAAEMGL